MSLRIGRVGLDISLADVSRWEDRDLVTYVDFSVRGIGHAAATRLRDQLLGYVDSPDEAFVPVVWDDDPSVAGYYVVLSVSVVPHGAAAFLGYYSFAVSMQRVTGFAAPLIELRSLGALRDGAEDLPLPVLVVPGSARSVGFWHAGLKVWIPYNPDVVREGATGDVKVYAVSNSVPQYYIDPGSFYEGAASLMMGDDLSPVVGRQVPNTPAAWRLSNGLYEIEPSGLDWFELRHRMWLDGAWTEWEPFLWYSSEGWDGRAPMPAPHSVVVLRNSPTEVGVQLLATANGEYSPVRFELSLKRGARSVAVELSSDFTSRFAIQGAGVTWSQDEDWYVWGDKAGVRHFIGSNQRIDLIGGGGIIPYEAAVVSVQTWSFTLGACDAAGTDLEGMIPQIRAWLWAGSETQAVVVQ